MGTLLSKSKTSKSIIINSNNNLDVIKNLNEKENKVKNAINNEENAKKLVETFNKQIEEAYILAHNIINLPTSTHEVHDKLIDNFKNLENQKDDALYQVDKYNEDSIKAQSAYKIAYEQAKMEDELIPYLNKTTKPTKDNCYKKNNYLIILIIFILIIILAYRNKNLLILF
jgi:hypothetical protein